jgi:hypothetical protein
MPAKIPLTYLGLNSTEGSTQGSIVTWVGANNRFESVQADDAVFRSVNSFYTITANTSYVDEDSVANSNSVAFTISNPKIDDAQVYYSFSGVQAADITTSNISGYINVVDGSATVIVTIANDAVQNETENIKFNILTGVYPAPVLASSSNIIIQESSTTNPVSWGQTEGYWVGGRLPTGSFGDAVQRLSWASDTSLTDVGEMYPASSPFINPTSGGFEEAGCVSSPDSGYWLGGSANLNSPPGYKTISPGRAARYTFASGTIADNLTHTKNSQMGTAMTPSHGYWMGGYASPPAVRYDQIQKFPFSSINTQTDVGELANHGIPGRPSATHLRHLASVTEENTNAYTYGGIGDPYSLSRVVQKFPFASDVSATTTGAVGLYVYGSATASTETKAWLMGGEANPNPTGPFSLGATNQIRSFTWASSGVMNDLGDLSQNKGRFQGTSSPTYVYTQGGSRIGATPFYAGYGEKIAISSSTPITATSHIATPGASTYAAGQTVAN